MKWQCFSVFYDNCAYVGQLKDYIIIMHGETVRMKIEIQITKKIEMDWTYIT
jgi:hypothetical protein